MLSRCVCTPHPSYKKFNQQIVIALVKCKQGHPFVFHFKTVFSIVVGEGEVLVTDRELTIIAPDNNMLIASTPYTNPPTRSHLPGWFKSLLPASALSVEEKAWNAYPYTKTVFSCPFVEKFSLEIETYYTPDGGQIENVFNLTVGQKLVICTSTLFYQDSELRTRVVDLIDVVKDQDQNYVAEEDPTVYVSEKTGRGPLSSDWVQEFSAACVVGLTLSMLTLPYPHFLGPPHAYPGWSGYHVCLQIMQGGVPVLGHAEQD